MRMMNVETSAMVKVVEKRGDRLVIIHPANGKTVGAPTNLYLSPPRCVAERDMRRKKADQRNRRQFRQAVEGRRQEEEELKEKVRRGEIPHILFKGGVFPILSGLTEKLIAEAREEEKPWLRKKIEEEVVRRCKYWRADEIFDGEGVSDGAGV